MWPSECPAGTHGKLAQALASHLRPAVLAEFDKAMAAVFVAGAEVKEKLNLPILFSMHICKCCPGLSTSCLQEIVILILAAL